MKPKNKTMGINEYDVTDTEFWTNFTEYSTDSLQQSISDKTNLEDIIKTLKIFFFSHCVCRFSRTCGHRRT